MGVWIGCLDCWLMMEAFMISGCVVEIIAPIQDWRFVVEEDLLELRSAVC